MKKKLSILVAIVMLVTAMPFNVLATVNFSAVSQFPASPVAVGEGWDAREADLDPATTNAPRFNVNINNPTSLTVFDEFTVELTRGEWWFDGNTHPVATSNPNIEFTLVRISDTAAWVRFNHQGINDDVPGFDNADDAIASVTQIRFILPIRVTAAGNVQVRTQAPMGGVVPVMNNRTVAIGIESVVNVMTRNSDDIFEIGEWFNVPSFDLEDTNGTIRGSVNAAGNATGDTFTIRTGSSRVTFIDPTRPSTVNSDTDAARANIENTIAEVFNSALNRTIGTRTGGWVDVTVNQARTQITVRFRADVTQRARITVPEGALRVEGDENFAGRVNLILSGIVSATFVAGTFADLGFGLELEQSATQAFVGRRSQAARITLTETVVGSLETGRNVVVEVDEGVDIVGVIFHGRNTAVGGTTLSNTRGGGRIYMLDNQVSRRGEVVFFQTGDNWDAFEEDENNDSVGYLRINDNSLTISDVEAIGNNNTVELGITLIVRASEAGPIRATVYGRALPDFERVLTVANAVNPFTITTNVTGVQNGSNIATASITITEAEAGLLRSDRAIYMFLQGLAIDDRNVEIEVTQGDLEIMEDLIGSRRNPWTGNRNRDSGYISTRGNGSLEFFLIEEIDNVEDEDITDNQIAFEARDYNITDERGVLGFVIETESTEASTIVISGIRINGVTNATPRGVQPIQIRGDINAAVNYINVGGEGTQPAHTFNFDAYVRFVIGSTTMTVNGDNVTMGVAPYIADSRTMVPVHYVARAFNFRVGTDILWNAATRTVTLTAEGRTVTMVIGSRTMTIDGQAVEMDAAPEITGDRTFLPIHWIAQAFDIAAPVWTEATSTVEFNAPDAE